MSRITKAQTTLGDLLSGDHIKVTWPNGDQLETTEGIFHGWHKWSGEYFLLLILADGREFQISTRCLPEVRLCR